jgi:hypothetical protein
MRSLRTQSSLFSRLLRVRARELKIVSPLGTGAGFFEKDISPHMAAEASPERRGKKDESLLRLGCFA